LWVYRDERRRGVSGVLWVVVVVLLGPLGVILYILMRPEGGRLLQGVSRLRTAPRR
jgi:hypothetical protein